MEARKRWRFGDKEKISCTDSPQLKKELLKEAHHAKYTVHPGTMKMYKDLKRNFWWKNIWKMWQSMPPIVTLVNR